MLMFADLFLLTNLLLKKLNFIHYRLFINALDCYSHCISYTDF